MKNLILIMMSLTLTATAQADYFGCEISQFGSVLASSEAEYRVLNSSVQYESFVCEGRITGSTTEVKLTEQTSGQVVTASANTSRATVSMSTLPRHNEYDIICSCGMH